MLKFAVVREDPELELDLARRNVARRVLTVASGGCTAFALKYALPELEVHASDLNPDQLAHCRAKQLAIAEGRLDDLSALSQRGEFEKLFRVLRSFESRSRRDRRPLDGPHSVVAGFEGPRWTRQLICSRFRGRAGAPRRAEGWSRRLRGLVRAAVVCRS